MSSIDADILAYPSRGDALSGKSVLVTGGTGCFGRRFVRHVLDDHDRREWSC